MAFATANVQSTYFGNLNVTYGDWSGAVGDAAGSLTVKGGRVYMASFTSQDTSTPQQIAWGVTSSQSGSTTTLTINNVESVTNGRFIVISK